MRRISSLGTVGYGLGEKKIIRKISTIKGEKVKTLVYKKSDLAFTKSQPLIIILSSHMPEISLKTQNGKIYSK